MSELKYRISKVDVPGLDVSLYYDTLTNHPENEWFAPFNSANSDDYKICQDLVDWNLIEKRIQPLWSDKGFRGHKIFFKYKNDLRYSNNT